MRSLRKPGWWLVLLLAAGGTACAPYQPRIEVDASSAFDGARYGTWNFVDPLTMERSGYPEAVVAQLRSAVDEAMAERGYRRAEAPAMLLDVAADLRSEGDAALHNDAYQALHSQRGTFHESWRGYGEGFGSSTRRQRYGDGRLDIGLIDAESRTMLWEAVAEGRLSGARSEPALAELVDGVARQMLARLPDAPP